MRKLLAILGLTLLIPAGIALADYAVTVGAGTTIFAFTCFTTKVCPVETLVDSTGTEKATVSNPVVVGANVGNSASALHVCGSYQYVFAQTATDTQIVNPVAGKNIYVCDYEFSEATGQNMWLESNTTGTSCGGTLVQLTMEWFALTTAKAAPNPFYRGVNTGTGNGLCWHTTAATQAYLMVYYDQY